MFINDKLKENIANSLSCEEDVSDIIDYAMETTWKDMTLAERCGPPIWDTLLWIAAVADDEENPQLYRRMLSVIEDGHPCKDKCRPHLRSNLQIVNLDDYSSCLNHCIDLHNLVNRQLGKAQYSPLKAKEKVDLGCDSCTFHPIGKSHSSQHQYVNQRNETNKRNETFLTNTQYIKPLSIESKTYKRPISESTIRYPINYRVRDKNHTRVYTSNRSSTYL